MTVIFLLILCIIPYCLAEFWSVYVYTGNEQFAGTDSNVYIRLINPEGESTSEAQLTHYNWLPDKKDFPLRNLFEKGAKERFLIRTENIGPVAKIQIRHNNFPRFQADWLLDQVIVESNRDGAKYIFKCNCWLRDRNPSVIISALSNRLTNNKDKESFSKNNRAFVIILVVLITLVVCIFCCFNEYRRRKRHRSISLNNAIEQIQQDPSLVDTCYPQTSSPSPPLSRPQLWINTIRQWKNFRNGSSSSYNHTRTTQSVTAVPTIIPTDEPPAYEDLYPNTTASINTNL